MEDDEAKVGLPGTGEKRKQPELHSLVTPQVYGLSLGLARAYLVEYEAGLALVDAGFPGHERRVLRRMRTLGRDDLRVIYITHAHLDHYGSAAALRRLTGAAIIIHRADGEAMARGETHLGSARGRGWLTKALLPIVEPWFQPEPTPADLLLQDGDDLRQFGLNGVVVHTPGHTPGSSCLLVDGRIAFAGDLLSSNGRPHVQGLYASDWSAIRDSMARLQALKPECVYPGHGRAPIEGSALQCLNRA